ncbi:transcription termination factor Rho [bacterium]|nr:transcription termination factor Rho [bacterium]
MSNSFSGILEIDQKGFGFTRALSLDLKSTPADVYVPQPLIRQFNLRAGALIEGEAKPSGKGSPQATDIKSINGLTPEAWSALKEFAAHDAIQPNEKIKLVGTYSALSMRVVELLCPIGKGQRGLIVAPPKAGKTRLLQEMAHAISADNPEIELLVLLIDERPEEVTDMRRTIRGEVFASSSDSEGGRHIRLAQLALEYAKRKVETGKDVVMLLDSLTRMGRAFNVHQKSSGRTLSGGVDIRALEIPKRIFGAARNLEGGGSLTIIATALIETNSRMDELIFQEFKGTGNMELALNRELAEERLFPAITVNASATRNEELLFGELTLQHQKLRRSIAKFQPKEALRTLLGLIEKFPTNEQLLDHFK